jgi:2-polyprenyl-3-methyl-5-hydroxy-6-metoxy-1,4-benzoquinol methylase
MSDQISGLLSPFLRAKRIRIVRPHLEGKVLDYGCGIGVLNELVRPENYVGVDIDSESIEIARKRYPRCYFYHMSELPAYHFYKTIVCLAVIEHLDSPLLVLKKFKEILSQNGKLIITTPHPSYDLIHAIGAHVGLFSQEGRKEHHELLNKDSLVQLATDSGFYVKHYQRFLLGANQLAILKHND